MDLAVFQGAELDLTDHFDHCRYVERDLQEVRAELGPGVTAEA